VGNKVIAQTGVGGRGASNSRDGVGRGGRSVDSLTRKCCTWVNCVYLLTRKVRSDSGLEFGWLGVGGGGSSTG
jgi:hypothetical protein